MRAVRTVSITALFAACLGCPTTPSPTPRQVGGTNPGTMHEQATGTGLGPMHDLGTGSGAMHEQQGTGSGQGTMNGQGPGMGTGEMETDAAQMPHADAPPAQQPAGTK